MGLSNISSTDREGDADTMDNEARYISAFNKETTDNGKNYTIREKDMK